MLIVIDSRDSLSSLSWFQYILCINKNKTFMKEKFGFKTEATYLPLNKKGGNKNITKM